MHDDRYDEESLESLLGPGDERPEPEETVADILDENGNEMLRDTLELNQLLEDGEDHLALEDDHDPF